MSHYRLPLFIALSVVLHTLLLSSWNRPLLFDFGGQQINQQTIALSLSAPPPKVPAVKKDKEEKRAAPPVEAAERPSPVESTPPQPLPAAKPPPPRPVQPALAPTRPSPSPSSRSKVKRLPPKKVVPKPPSPKRPQPQQRPKPVAVQKKTIIQPPTAQEVSPLKPPPLTKINQPPSETQSRAMVYRLIQAELVRHFQYPRLARRRGWEGTTHIEFIVEPSGKITQIRVKKGSQHGLLNRSAVDTLSRINRLKQIVPGFITAPIRMEVPIIYRLQ